MGRFLVIVCAVITIMFAFLTSLDANADGADRIFLPSVLRLGQVAPGISAPTRAAPTPGTSLPSEHGAIVLSVSTRRTTLIFPGEPEFGSQPIRNAPWYLVYADGTFVWSAEDRYSPVTGLLTESQLSELMDVLTNRALVFELPEPPAYPSGPNCATDQNYTDVYLKYGQRERRVSIYALEWYARGIEPCRDHAADQRLNELGRAVEGFRKIPANARPYSIRLIRLLAETGHQRSSTHWPLAEIDIERTSWLDGESARRAIDALRANKRPGQLMVPFEQGGKQYAVGARVQFEGE